MENSIKEYRLNIRIRKEYYDYISKKADEKGSNMSQIIRELIIEQYKKEHNNDKK